MESQHQILELLTVLQEENIAEELKEAGVDEAFLDEVSRIEDDFQFDQTIDELETNDLDGESQLEPQEAASSNQQTIFSCDICKSSFENADELQDHLHLHIDTESFPCQHCNREFSTSERLQRHSLVHKVTENRSILKSNARKIKEIIKDEKSGRFICQICNGSYATRSILTHHQLKHSRAKNFVCHLCPREFHFVKDLRTHVTQYHLERKRFCCTECNSDYSTSSALKKHALTHKDNAKNFLCDKCEMTFSTKGSFTVHSRIHNGEKPFVCHLCTETKAFAQKINLQRHMKTIHNENIFKCDWCQLSFEKKGELREHWTVCENFRNRNEPLDEFIVTTEDMEYEANEQNESAVKSIETCFNEV